MSIQAGLRIAVFLLQLLKKLTPPMKRKTNQFSVRLDPQLQADVDACVAITGLDPALFMREAFKAFVAEVREKGEIRLPLAIVPKKSSGLFPSPARALPSAPSLNEEASRPGAVPSRANTPAPSPLEKYTGIRPAARKPKPKS
jgi:hypothetical protein